MIKRLVVCVCSVVLALANTPYIFAEIVTPLPRKSVMIAELQTMAVLTDATGKETAKATAEFVELYNPNPATLDVTGWKLQYRSAASTADKPWSTVATLECGEGCVLQVAPRGRLLVATTDAGLADADIVHSLGFADYGGQVRLMSVDEHKNEQQEDLLGYGKTSATSTAPITAYAEAIPATAHGKKQSLKRKVSEDGEMIDTNNNANDFFISDAPSPKSDDPPVLPEEPESPPIVEEPTPAPNPVPDKPGMGGGREYALIELSELLPNPAAPLTDEHDEFIELYNPHDTEVVLEGYSLEAGSTWGSKYHFSSSDRIAPHGYLAVYADVSPLALSNSGSQVRIVDPAGTVLDVTVYAAAEAGYAWAKDEAGIWKWTTTPTAEKQNQFTTPGAAVLAAATAIKSAVKKVVAAKASAPRKVATAKTASKTTAKASADKAAKAPPAETTLPGTTNMWLVATASLLALGYGAYEYKYEAWQFVRRLFHIAGE
jgi:hypothetical protein